jgi:hypothetical protein
MRSALRIVSKEDPCAAAKRLLFYHLVGAGKYCRRNCDTERLRGLGVDESFKKRRLFYGKISGLRTLKDFIDIIWNTTVNLSW